MPKELICLYNEDVFSCIYPTKLGELRTGVKVRFLDTFTEDTELFKERYSALYPNSSKRVYGIGKGIPQDVIFYISSYKSRTEYITEKRNHIVNKITKD